MMDGEEQEGPIARGTTGQSKNVMLARDLNRQYVGLVTGLQGEMLIVMMTSPMLHFRSGNIPEPAYAENYYNAAEASVLYAAEQLPNHVNNLKNFLTFIQRFSERGSYTNEQGVPIAQPELRPRDKKRGGAIPSYLIYSFNQILARCGARSISTVGMTPIDRDSFGELYGVFNDDSTLPLDKVLEKLRYHAEQVILLDKHQASHDRVLSEAIKLYRLTEIAWLWDRGNHSRSTNLFNGLLGALNHQPDKGLSMPHGVMDLAAFCMDEEQFVAYVKFCRSIKLEVQ